MDVHVGLWILFAVIVCTALFVDIGLKSHRGAHHVSFKEAALWSILWVTLALGFAGAIHAAMGPERAFEYITAYLMEESLSVDNMFVFVMIFKYFSIPDAYQHKVLRWGIFGAIAMRFGIIFTGVAILNMFHWMMYVFGAFLIFTAFKMFNDDPEDMHPENNPLLKVLKRFIPLSHEFNEHHFFKILDGQRHATPLFAALIVVEASDLIFAIDSIPAVLAVSRDPFIIFTSNVFAIMGLRSLYFMVHGMIGYFRYLRYGLGIVLLFIGGKMLCASFIKIPIGISLGTVAFVIGVSILLSVLIKDEMKSDKPS